MSAKIWMGIGTPGRDTLDPAPQDPHTQSEPEQTARPYPALCIGLLPALDQALGFTLILGFLQESQALHRLFPFLTSQHTVP